jgi:hypothetical protein
LLHCVSPEVALTDRTGMSALTVTREGNADSTPWFVLPDRTGGGGTASGGSPLLLHRSSGDARDARGQAHRGRPCASAATPDACC